MRFRIAPDEPSKTLVNLVIRALLTRPFQLLIPTIRKDINPAADSDETTKTPNPPPALHSHV
jgi:hypothetical protein